MIHLPDSNYTDYNTEDTQSEIIQIKNQASYVAKPSIKTLKTRNNSQPLTLPSNQPREQLKNHAIFFH